MPGVAVLCADAQAAQLAAKASGIAAAEEQPALRRAQFHGRQLQGSTVSLAPGVGARPSAETSAGRAAAAQAPMRAQAMWCGRRGRRRPAVDSTHLRI